MVILPILAVLSTVHLEDDVVAGGGDYVVVPFSVPAGTVEIQISHTDGSDVVILDWGVWAPGGVFRGWGGGLTDDAIIGVDESSRGYLEGPIAAGTWELVIGKAKLAGGMGHYSVDVVCRDDVTLTPTPRAPWQPVVLESGERWYAGDFHVHSDESGDATATFDEITALARSRGIDFIALSDHNTVSHHDRIGAYQPGVADVLFLRAIEVTTYAGHGNAIGVGAYVDHRIGLAGRTSAGITADVRAQGGRFLLNHPALDLGESCIGCAWGHTDTPWADVAALEVLTGPYDLVVNTFTPLSIELWDARLAEGHHIAAVGGSDDHRAGMGTGLSASVVGSPATMVLATELSEAAIMDAVVAGRTVVNLRGPDDPMVELVALDGDTVIGRIGDTVADAREIVVEAHVTGGEGMDLELWQDGALVSSTLVTSADWRERLTLPRARDGERVRAELNQSGGQRIVITSHLWFTGAVPAPADGGGCCRTGAGGDAPGAFLFALSLLAARAAGGHRRRRDRARARRPSDRRAWP
jgi:hypothetical protein